MFDIKDTYERHIWIKTVADIAVILYSESFLKGLVNSELKITNAVSSVEYSLAVFAGYDFLLSQAKNNKKLRYLLSLKVSEDITNKQINLIIQELKLLKIMNNVYYSYFNNKTVIFTDYIELKTFIRAVSKTNIVSEEDRIKYETYLSINSYITNYQEEVQHFFTTNTNTVIFYKNNINSSLKSLLEKKASKNQIISTR